MLKAMYEKEMKTGKMKLLGIKESQIRMITLKQAYHAVDKGIHIGGCFSSVIPMVCLYYGGFININVENPTSIDQDRCIFSKGHSIALLASIYYDLGYFDSSVLYNSRSCESILNGHPGPLLPGVEVSTGPLGQGISVAAGLSLIGKRKENNTVYCVVGDGELQEGILWEPVMYAAYKKLDNFCVLVDRNRGQLDDVKNTVIDMGDIKAKFEAFGWKVIDIDATQMENVYNALEEFKRGDRNGRPVAIICNSYKGFGGFSDHMAKHKITLTESLYHREYALQKNLWEKRKDDFSRWVNSLDDEDLKDSLISEAAGMNINLQSTGSYASIDCGIRKARLKKVPERDNKIIYEENLLPSIDKNREYAASEIITRAMEVFATDERVVSIDSDLSSTSGLYAGIASVDRERALNVGVAEANMMGIGEAFAVCGYNVWVSTFCPFFDWKVLRRISVGYQERMEAIRNNSWLSKGHELNITFLATASNLDSGVNGATHIGNDDIMVFDEIANLKIIDISCPRQLLSVMKWIMEGGRGLVYLRIMRAPSRVLYGDDYRFEYGRGYFINQEKEADVVLISSGRGVHEAVSVANQLEEKGLAISVVDMPSIDAAMLKDLYDQYKILVFAEQNNGFIYKNFMRIMFDTGNMIDTAKIKKINLLDEEGRKRFIHSGTVRQLIEAYGLSADGLADKIWHLVRP